jgi:hypothetical protein
MKFPGYTFVRQLTRLTLLLAVVFMVASQAVSGRTESAVLLLSSVMLLSGVLWITGGKLK